MINIFFPYNFSQKDITNFWKDRPELLEIYTKSIIEQMCLFLKLIKDLEKQK